jgi:hypothetical protein
MYKTNNNPHTRKMNNKGASKMSIEEGTIYQISQNVKGFFNSAEALTVIRDNGVTIQFTLGDGKGHGSMPIQHLQYLLKRSELTQISHKRDLLSAESEEQTG